MLRGRLLRFFANLGPGLITGAADDDPSGISTYSVTGAAFGYAPLWTAIFSFPLMTAVQIMCARLGMVTGLGLAGVIRRRYPRWILWGACALLVVANIVNIAADLGGMADVTATSDWHPRILLDSGLRAVPDRPALLDQLPDHRAHLQMADAGPVRLYRRRVSGSPGLACRLACHAHSHRGMVRQHIGRPWWASWGRPSRRTCSSGRPPRK